MKARSKDLDWTVTVDVRPEGSQDEWRSQDLWVAAPNAESAKTKALRWLKEDGLTWIGAVVVREDPAKTGKMAKRNGLCEACQKQEGRQSYACYLKEKAAKARGEEFKCECPPKPCDIDPAHGAKNVVGTD